MATRVVITPGVGVHRGGDYRNGAFKGAYSKGWNAGYSGEDASTCPYEDRRTETNKVTFSRGLIRAWKRGRLDGLASKAASSELSAPSEAAEMVKANQKRRRRSIITK